MAELSRQLATALPDARGLSRAIVDAGMAWNATDRLHQLLWRAPRSKALVERLGEIDDQMITDLEWHLLRFGHDPSIARLRAQLVVTTIEAVVHSQPVQGDRQRQAEELVELCTSYMELH